MPKHHILDGEPPPEPVRIPWFRYGAMGSAIAVILVVAGVMTWRSLNPSEGETGPLVVVHCTSCDWADMHRVSDITQETCPTCGKPAGYGMRCTSCKAIFGYQPALAEADADGVPPPPTCPECGSTAVEPLLGVPGSAKPSADER